MDIHNIPKIRGIAKLEIWISDPSKIGLKAYCEQHRITMKDLVDFLIKNHLLKNAPELLEIEQK